jgi:hypothetical protein
MKTAEQIKNEIQDLTRNLSRSNLDQYKIEIDKIRTLETELKKLELTNKINYLNKLFVFKREVISEFLKIGEINTDLITNDGKLNKGRKKGNEKLFDFCEKYKVTFDKHEIHFISAENYALRFSLWKTIYIDGNETKIENVSFDKILNYYNIPCKPLNVKQVEKQLIKIEKLSNEFKNKIEEHEKKLKDLNSYFFDSNSFFYQSEQRVKQFKSRY